VDLVNLTWSRRTIRPRHRFATSQGCVDEKQVITVQLEHAGRVGLGEVVPSRLYGQSLESSEAALEKMRACLGDDPFALEPILARAIAAAGDQRAAIAGLDSALHDWVGKALGIPVWRLLGLERPQIRTTFTLGLAPRSEMRIKLREALDEGHAALKVKIGGPEDHEILSMIRAEFDGPLLLDANEAWSPANAREHIAALARFRPTLIEQPLPQARWREMAPLRNNGVAPIFADESSGVPADVIKLHGCVDGLNVKFTKCGGIREALRMIALARAFGMQVMLGCFVSTSLAIAPALAIASLADFADLDGHLLLARDPYRGIESHAGLLSLPDRPGLGVTEDSSA
jgi:L-alanine-DL-glutamate epimerase-like enolase superfamily enzyme